MEKICGLALIGFIISTFIAAIVLDNRESKTYGEKTYEIVIDDKYENLGSTFHIIGGRATETEYHLVYRYRLANRPKDKTASVWQEIDREVSYLTYREYNVGDRLTSSSAFFW